jgi:methionyl-tRNA synthetase
MLRALLRRSLPLKPDAMSDRPSAEPYYITTAISYPNGRPHIGHAYEAIAADAIARFHRLSGRNVRFQTGTDEHGLKMVQTARDKGVDVRDLSRDMSDEFQAMCDKLNISYDHFQRTTDPAHHRASVAIWEAMQASGDLYLDRYEGWYSVRDEAFYEEKELRNGEGGIKLSPQDTPVEWTVEESWFFKLSKYQQPLLELYEKQPDFIRPESRRNEVMRFVEGGLRDLSMSRTSFDWGVKVPGSPDHVMPAGGGQHVMYVWVDALTNYLTGLGYPDMDGDMAKYWPASLHLIGKDIVRFHAVYWPAFLMSAGLPLPKQVFGHGFLLARGEKMSKSVGNVVDPIELADMFGVDALRYFLLREVSFGSDGSYSEDAIVTRVNADLANNFGNLAQRSLSMIAKNCDGKVPTPGAFTPQDKRLFQDIIMVGAAADVLMQDLKIGSALETIWEGMSAANLYFAEQAPWTVRKSDAERADTILYCAIEAVRLLAIRAYWAIPAGSTAILKLLGRAAPTGLHELDHALVPGVALPVPSGVFPRLELSA